MNTLKAIFLLAVLTIAAVVVVPPPRRAEARADGAAETSDQVAYIKMIDGDLGYQRGDDDKGEWNPAAVNSPLMPGDSLYTPDTSKAELQVGGDSFLRLADLAYVGILQNSNDIFQVKLTSGVATLRVEQLDRTYEIDSPAMAFTPQKPGEYRFGVKENGETSVTVQEGEGVASVSEGNNQTLGAGRQLTVSGGGESGTSASAPMPAAVSAPAAVKSDPVEQWNQARDKVELNSTSGGNVPQGVTGADALDTTGHWLATPAYGNAWVPNGVAAGWQPYQAGRWVWVDPYGWSWVSYESWGWAPYHYGRWAVVDGIWVWLPGSGPQVYSPGLVAFVGDGDDFGWFPLGPSEPYVAVIGVGFCCRPYREYYNYRYVTVINRTEIVNAHYSYTRVDNHFYERATTARGLEIRPTRDTLYARRDAHGVLDARGHVAAHPVPARFTPPAKIANNNRPVRAIHDAPAVKSFNAKLAEMPKSGPPRGVNPVDTSRKAVAATMPRPAALQSTPPKSFKVPSAAGNAGAANRLQPPASGPKKFEVPASPTASHAAESKPNEVPNKNGSAPAPATNRYAPPSASAKAVPNAAPQSQASGAYKPPTSAGATAHAPNAPAGGGQPSTAYHPPTGATGNTGAARQPSSGAAGSAAPATRQTQQTQAQQQPRNATSQAKAAPVQQARPAPQQARPAQQQTTPPPAKKKP